MWCEEDKRACACVHVSRTFGLSPNRSSSIVLFYYYFWGESKRAKRKEKLAARLRTGGSHVHTRARRR